MNTHIAYTPEYLSQIYSPEWVVDVGVGNGTPALYKAFPYAKFLLIEPMEEFSGSIKSIQENYNCEVIYTALGSVEGEKTISFPKNDLQKATLAIRSDLTKPTGEVDEKIVQVTTLHKILHNRITTKKAILLKIDTEGFEMEVLKGAGTSLNLIDMVIAEVSISKRFENSYTFEEMIAFMDQNGFSVFAFLTMKYKREDLRPKYTDIVFKRRETVNSLSSY